VKIKPYRGHRIHVSHYRGHLFFYTFHKGRELRESYLVLLKRKIDIACDMPEEALSA